MLDCWMMDETMDWMDWTRERDRERQIDSKMMDCHMDFIFAFK
jgi:hypothetical protein